MGNKETNYPDILPLKQPPKQLSLSCNSRVKIGVNVYNNTTTNDIISWKVIQGFSDYVTNIWDSKTPSDQYPHGTRVQNSKTLLLAYFQITVKTRREHSAQRFSVFHYHD